MFSVSACTVCVKSFEATHSVIDKTCCKGREHVQNTKAQASEESGFCLVELVRGGKIHRDTVTPG